MRHGTCANQEFVALVAELGKKLAGGVLQREGPETGEGGAHEKDEFWNLKGLECQPDQIGNEVEVGIVAEQGEIEFRRERGWECHWF